MKHSIKSVIHGGVALFALSMSLISCNGALEDILGAQDNPTNVAVTSITLNETTLYKNKGDAAVTLTAAVVPENAADKTVTWSSDNPAVASVNNGEVTALAIGTAIITATANDGSGVKATCTVNVSAHGLLSGDFSIAADKKVRFAQGNLQAVFASAGSSCTWQFATNQWDYIGNAAANNAINGNGSVSDAGTVDLFGWVGNSSVTLTDTPAKYGITNLATGTDYGVSPNTDNLKSDWGTLLITNGGDAPNYGWRTLTKDEWVYVLKTRESGNTISGTDNARFAKAKLFNTTHGLIIFPDNYTHPDGVADPTGINKIDNTSWDANQYTTADWDKMAAAGCVFLPAAGMRAGVMLSDIDGAGRYWSSTYSSWDYSCVMNFHYNEVNPEGGQIGRGTGCSVRLVMDVK